MRSDILLLLSLIALSSLISPTCALFEDNPNIQILTDPIDFQFKVITHEFVTAWVFYTEKSERCQMFAPAYEEFAEKFHDYIKVFAVDCVAMRESSNGPSFPLCKEEHEEYLPAISFFEPSPMKFNPYTKQAVRPKEHQYQGDGTPDSLFAFGRKFIPAYRQRLTTANDLSLFLNKENYPNKVILFTNKPETSPLYKAVTCEYRGKLWFGEIQDKASDLVSKYEITKFPSIIVLTRQEDGEHETVKYTGDMNIKSIKSFLEEYALKEKVTNLEEDFFEDETKKDSTSSKDKKDTKEKKAEDYDSTPPGLFKPKFFPIGANNFTEEVNKHEGLVLIHLYKSKDEGFKILKEVTDRFQSLFFYFEMDLSLPENENFAGKELLIKSWPSLVVLPLGKEKRFSQRLFLPKTKELIEILHDVSDIIPDKSTPLSVQEIQIFNAELFTTKKPSFIFFYDGEDTSMSFRVATNLERFAGNYRFARFKNPAPEVKQMFQITKLPLMIAMFLDDPTKDIADIKNEDVRIAHYNGRFLLHEVLKFFDSFLPEDEILNRMKVNKKVNVVDTQADFDKYCPRDSKLCVIGLFNGYQGTDEAKAKYNENIEVLNHAIKKYSTFSYIVIDAVCHSEILIDLNIMAELLPNLILYDPFKKEYAQLIGNFDKNDILSFIDRYSRGKVGGYVLPQGFQVKKQDCEAVHQRRLEQENASGLSPEDEEILREILEEERLKKEALEEELEGKKKKKKKSKKNKNDEL